MNFLKWKVSEFELIFLLAAMTPSGWVGQTEKWSMFSDGQTVDHYSGPTGQRDNLLMRTGGIVWQ